MAWLACVPAWPGDESSSPWHLGQGDSANPASCKCHHDDEYLREDGKQRRNSCHEDPRNHVCNYCATTAFGQHAGDVEMNWGHSAKDSAWGGVTGIWRRGRDSNPRYRC